MRAILPHIATRSESGTRHLIQQWLQEVMMAAVEHRQLHRGTLQRTGRCEPADPPPIITMWESAPGLLWCAITSLLLGLGALLRPTLSP
jgi:hypothetical protein